MLANQENKAADYVVFLEFSNWDKRKIKMQGIISDQRKSMYFSQWSKPPLNGWGKNVMIKEECIQLNISCPTQ